ncbi:MAG TPA: methyltransferase [Alphaproteobacteria bacterium]|nr:methyltransferase [Alphaproteobacteria bacterium]
MHTTLNGLLNKRITIEQPEDGYRVAIDTVLLAAAVPAEGGQKVCDLGCGAGGAMLCLAARVPGVTITGIEIDAALARLAVANSVRNGFQERCDVRGADATRLPADFAGRYNHVLMNPPYHDEARHDVSEHAQKRLANSEKPGDLGRWIASAAMALTPDGLLTMIQRADREGEIIGFLHTAFGGAEIVPILPKEGEAPKRIVLRARKRPAQSRLHFGEKFCRPLVLHKPDGAYTDEAEGILRHMQAVIFAAA